MRTKDKNKTIITGYGKLYLKYRIGQIKKNYNLVGSYKKWITYNISSFLPKAFTPNYAKTIVGIEK